MRRGRLAVLIPINNSGIFTISGNGAVNLTNIINQVVRGTFNSLNANITVSGTLTISNGIARLGGNMNASSVQVNNGILIIPNGMKTDGSLVIDSVLLVESNATTQSNPILVSNFLQIRQPVLIKFPDFGFPRPGSKVDTFPPPVESTQPTPLQ